MRAPLWFLLAFLMLGCHANELQDPRSVAQNFGRALERGDAEGVEAMMSQGAMVRFGKRGIRQRLREQAPELKRLASALRAPHAELRVTPEAQVQFANGRLARLVLEGDAFRIDFSGGLPPRAKTPTEALEALHGALVLFPGSVLFQTLSPKLRASVEIDLGGLRESLEAPEAAHIEIDGDRATATLLGGYVVTLVSDEGLWFVEDFR